MTTSAPVQYTLEDEVYDFLMSQPTLEQLASFTLSEAHQERYLELGARNNDGTITPTEYQELEAYVRVYHLMNQFRLRALYRIQTMTVG